MVAVQLLSDLCRDPKAVKVLTALVSQQHHIPPEKFKESTHVSSSPREEVNHQTSRRRWDIGHAEVATALRKPDAHLLRHSGNTRVFHQTGHHARA